MPQSLACLDVHIVFSTKNREPLIAADRREDIWKYLAGILRQLHCPVIEIGGVADHVHVYCSFSRTISMSKLVDELKVESSKWAKTNVHPNFYWQNGYAAFSVSRKDRAGLVGYIRNQEQHHTLHSYQDEYRELLQQHGLEWDERYVWD